MESKEIRSRFLKFFGKRGHKIIPSASLVPENDPSVLFTTAGMHPLISYLMGQPHPMGVRLVDVQKCVRTQDIDEVGDKTHDTFFEMLGNWSLGDYFKKDAIKWSYEFLTSKEEGLGLDVAKLYITCFEGDENAPKDTESAKIWQSLGIPKDRIYFLGAKDNWWSPGDNGPCGPDTEMFYDIAGNLGDMNKDEFLKASDEQKIVEIWNDVFMEYEKKDGKIIGKLKKQNVDTGAGLERTSMVMQKTDSIFATDLFLPIMNKINELAGSGDERAKRIIADHIRTAVFMIVDGVIPSNTHRGYVLRRLLRRAIYLCNSIGMKKDNLLDLADSVFFVYKDTGYELEENENEIKTVIRDEELSFKTTLESGKKELEKRIKIGNFSGEDAFKIYSTYGYPLELITEVLKENNQKFSVDNFWTEYKKHQKLSQTASVGMFKGGLADHNEKTIKLHTAHHLLLAGLQNIVGKSVKQRGSNITEERLRMDFLCDHKLTDEEKKKVEGFVNEKICAGFPVIRREMPLLEAEKIGAEMEFGAKYPDVVSLYFIEDQDGNVISKEFCGGPHVKNTAELYPASQAQPHDDGPFKILKEEAVAQGIRRIKAVLE